MKRPLWLLLLSFATALSRCPLVEATIEARGEFLYLHPSFPNTQYAIVVAEPNIQAPAGRVHEVRSRPSPGFRVSLGWLDSRERCDVTVSYTHLHHSRKDRTEATGDEGLWPAIGSGELINIFGPATADARLRFSYDAVELQVAGRSIHDPGILCLRAFGGLQYARIGRTFVFDLTGNLDGETPTTGHLHTRSHLWGVGPCMGVDLRLDVFCHFGIGGLFTLGLLAGESHLHYNEETQVGQAAPVLLNLGFGGDLSLYPHCHARLGINYCLRRPCFTIRLEVGYEFIDYLRALELVNFTGENAAFNVLCQDARMNGLYAFVEFDF